MFNLQSRRTNLCIAVVFSILSHRAGNEMSLMFTPAQLRSHLFDRTDSLHSYIFFDDALSAGDKVTEYLNTCVERIFGGMLLGTRRRYFLFESKLRRLMLLC